MATAKRKIKKVIKVLGVSTSPRTRGNTELLLEEVLKGAKEKGARVEKLLLGDYRISPCTECDRCFRKGECVIKDGMQVVYDKFLSCDRLVFAAPIYFMAHCSQAKVLIDRCQALWARKHIQKIPLFEKKPSPPRQGLFIATGGRKGRSIFTGAQITMQAFFSVLEMEYKDNLLFDKIDQRGAILNHPTAMKKAFKAGKDLVG